MICNNITKDSRGKLYFAGMDVSDLAKSFGTPLYLFDEERIRSNCRVYTEAMKKYFPQGSSVCYASKAASFAEIYRIAMQEGMCVDVVSRGEIYTALKAGFPLKRAFFHSNNKTDEDIAFAIERGIGYFVCDCEEELLFISSVAKERNITQKVILRLTPGIDPHTYEAVATGKVDSKFGSAIETGQAFDITRTALSLEGVELCGFHCHVGSQVFDSTVFFDAAKIMLEYVARVKAELGYEAEILDLGGGYGVRYVEDDPFIDIGDNLRLVSEFVADLCKKLSLKLPKIHMEPGRSIVADAGMTLYTVGSVKRIPGYKNYVSIDGGMTDNPRFALYGSKYTVLCPDKMNEENTFSCDLVGRCCESGDVIQESIKLPATVKRGDLIAVCTTGAYNYSMASNYNRLPRPAIVMIRDKSARVVVERESLEDIVRLDK
ncbi:MAG: diaminopimelate decarboxylase [Ruminococcaceae bacterium]|nr:diaminopimelate decarboxylase [Oscillospiraceae bacterium]